MTQNTIDTRIASARETTPRIAPHDDASQERYSIARQRDGQWEFYSQGLSCGPCFLRDHAIEVLRAIRSKQPYCRREDLRAFAHRRNGRLDAEDFALLMFRVIDGDWGVWE